MADQMIHIENPTAAALQAFENFEHAVLTHPQDLSSVLEAQSTGNIPSDQSREQLQIGELVTRLLDETADGFYIDYDQPLLGNVLNDVVYKGLVKELTTIEKDDRSPHIRKMALRGLSIYVRSRLAQMPEAS